MRYGATAAAIPEFNARDSSMRIPFRYSLRAFLALAILSATAVGLWARRSLEQRKHVRILSGARFDVIYDLDQQRERTLLVGIRTQLAGLIGKDWVAVPIEIKATAYSVDSDVLAVLPKFRSLRVIDLQSTTADDRSLAAIAQLPRIEILKLDGTLVTDVGLAHLNKCRTLRELALGETLVPPTAVDEFRQKHRNCRVTSIGPRTPASVASQQEMNLSASRMPTATETAQLNVAIRLLEEKDNAVKYRLTHQLAELTEPPDPYRVNLERDNPRYFKLVVQNMSADFGQDSAIRTLGALGLADGISALERVARDVSRDAVLRTIAIQSLSHIADTRIVPILIDLMEDPSNEVAHEAWHRLMRATGLRIGAEQEWDSDSKSEYRRTLPDRWRRHWEEGRDVISLQRAATFGDH